MRIWSFIFLLTLTIPMSTGSVIFDENKVGVVDGVKFNLQVVNVEGNFQDSINEGKIYRIEVVNSTVTNQNTIIVKDSSFSKIPVFMDTFGSWIVFTDWDNWDIFWEIERTQSNSNYSVEIFHSRDEFKVVTKRITTYSNPEISEFNQITEVIESSYAKENGIAIELIIHQDLTRFDGGSSKNELIISNQAKINDRDSIFDFIYGIRLTQIVAVGIIAFAIIYPYLKEKSKAKTNLQIDQGYN